MTTSPKHQCEALKPDGTRRASFALPGGLYCFSHEPPIAADRIAARRNGGRHHGTAPRLRKYLPPEARELYGTLKRAFVQIHEATLDPKVGHALANVAKAMVATLGVSKTEYELLRRSKQLAQLEARIHDDDTTLNESSPFSDLTSAVASYMTISRKVTNDEPLAPEEEHLLKLFERSV